LSWRPAMPSPRPSPASGRGGASGSVAWPTLFLLPQAELGCSFSRWREKVPKADEGARRRRDGVVATCHALTPTLSRKRERGNIRQRGVSHAVPCSAGSIALFLLPLAGEGAE